MVSKTGLDIGLERKNTIPGKGEETMQKLQNNHGYPKVKRAMRYASIRLRSKPETVALAQEIDAERSRLDKANEAYEQSVEERVAATALIGHLDSLVDEGVAAIARDVAVITANRPDDAFYKALFPVAPSTATAPVASESQNRFVKALIDRIQSDSRYESLRGRAATLKQAQSDLDAALSRREELRTPEQRTAADLQAALESARRAYNKLHPKLSLLFESKSYIETFFATVRKSDKPGGEAEDESTPTETAQ
jgi:signal transduction histidine kinase